MKKTMLMAMLTTVIMVSCSKNTNYTKEIVNGVEITTNKNSPSDPNFKIDLKDEVIIDLSKQDPADTNSFVSEISNYDLDSAGNIYVLDGGKSHIFKFDSTGKFIQRFGNKGQGPGEFIFGQYLVVLKDTLYIAFDRSLKMIKYDLNGNYLCEKRYSNAESFPSAMWKSGNFICATSVSRVSENVYERKLGLYDNKFNIKQYFYKDRIDNNQRVKDLNMADFLSIAVSHNNLVYVPIYSPSIYGIDVFDLKGNLVKKIKKNCLTIPFPKEEIKRLEGVFKEYGMTVKGTIKNTIDFVQTDKYDRLLVKSAINGKNNNYNHYDVFKDGIYLNTVQIGEDSTAFSSYFYDERAVLVDSEKKIIKLYKY